MQTLLLLQRNKLLSLVLRLKELQSRGLCLDLELKPPFLDPPQESLFFVIFDFF